jgi:uncharacterized protein (TIGR00369 family)
VSEQASPTHADLAAIAHRIFDAQPFTKWIGAELRQVGPGCAEIFLQNRPQIHQQHGFIHGGVISYLADNALTFAGGLALGGDAVTAEHKINFVRPAVGDFVIARASVLTVTKSQAVCQCLVYAADTDGETIVAVAQGTISKAHSPSP